MQTLKYEKKLGLYRQFFRFLQIFEKRAPTKAKYLLPVSQILQKETQESLLSQFCLSCAY